MLLYNYTFNAYTHLKNQFTPIANNYQKHFSPELMHDSKLSDTGTDFMMPNSHKPLSKINKKLHKFYTLNFFQKEYLHSMIQSYQDKQLQKKPHDKTHFIS